MPVPTDITQISETASSNSPGGSEPVGTLANDYFQAAFAFIKQLYDGKWLPTQAVPLNNQRLIGVANGVGASDAATMQQLYSTLGAPSGTRIVFQQAAAPFGWVVDGSDYLQDCAVRFNAGAGHGGASGWSAWNFGGTFSTDGTAINWNQMPSHNHADSGHGHNVGDPGHNHGVNDPGHAHNISYQSVQAGNTIGGVSLLNGGGSNKSTDAAGTGIYLSASGTGIWIGTGYASITYAGGGQAHSHTFRGPQVKYCDVIVCVKQ